MHVKRRGISPSCCAAKARIKIPVVPQSQLSRPVLYKKAIAHRVTGGSQDYAPAIVLRSVVDRKDAALDRNAVAVFNLRGDTSFHPAGFTQNMGGAAELAIPYGKKQCGIIVTV